MTNNSGNWLSTLLNALLALFRRPGGGIPQPPLPSVPADNTTEPARIVTSRILLVIYDPVMDPETGEKLSSKMNWQRVDDLVTGFIADIATTSGGLARYQVIERIDAGGMAEIFKGATPFLAAIIATAVILTIFPQIALYLPSLMGR